MHRYSPSVVSNIERQRNWGSKFYKINYTVLLTHTLFLFLNPLVWLVLQYISDNDTSIVVWLHSINVIAPSDPGNRWAKRFFLKNDPRHTEREWSAFLKPATRSWRVMTVLATSTENGSWMQSLSITGHIYTEERWQLHNVFFEYIYIFYLVGNKSFIMQESRPKEGHLFRSIHEWCFHTSYCIGVFVVVIVCAC